MKIIFLVVLVFIGALASRARVRREGGERARDLSDRLMMLLLRLTSGFAADVPQNVVQEERERRLRWRRP